MAVLVTRPEPDNETTAAALRARGVEVLLAPTLRFEPVPLPESLEADHGAIIVTSANALRAIAPQLIDHPLLKLPLFAVGEQTAAAARRAGFGQVISADGDASALRELVADRRMRASPADAAKALLYLAGADISRDLAGELGARGFDVVTRITYRMVPIPSLPRETCDAFAANRVDAVLHYSGRSARAFLTAARAAGVEISALAIAQCCISSSVAQVLREAGAARVTVAASPNENALLEALTRAI
jgi:uroporphyrinogen-III synthase